MWIFLFVIGVLLVLFWFIAGEFYEIAKMKGHPQKKYFWWCFWTTFYGYLMVIALPDRSEKSTGGKMLKEKAEEELPDL